MQRSAKIGHKTLTRKTEQKKTDRNVEKSNKTRAINANMIRELNKCICNVNSCCIHFVR